MGLRAITIAILSVTLLPGVSFASESGTGGCKLHTWDSPSQPTRVGAPRPGPPRATPSVPRTKDLGAGDVNCRYEGRTYDKVDTSTCQVLADRYGIDLGKFYELNPILEADCSRIRPNTEYCVTGSSVTKTPEHVKYVPSNQLTEYAGESKVGIHSAHVENGEIAAIFKENAGMVQNFAAGEYVKRASAVTRIIHWMTFHLLCHGSLGRVYLESETSLFIRSGEV
ncbi:unnamed protein product [Clonostachys rosea]|uniref:LysM domain-containing protein n=1 Tax=Bionectria ochroleuca TaxID=29856 RepID=A0ABY6UZQ7_BIOOC|nr:unnamed protein product [Clonostachys rosea]